MVAMLGLDCQSDPALERPNTSYPLQNGSLAFVKSTVIDVASEGSTTEGECGEESSDFDEYVGKHPSIGSALHSSGECKRCCFFPKGRCDNGYDCSFCHYDHGKRTRTRRNRKSKME